MKKYERQTQDPEKRIAAAPAAQVTQGQNRTAAAGQSAAAVPADASRPVYTGSYDAQVQDLFGQIQNRPGFSYDVNADPLYQQYKDQYIQQGKLAMRDTMGRAAALTGGYSTTYGQQVGQQAYDAYLKDLGEVIPTLYQQAYTQYKDEGDRLMQLYGLAGDMQDREYARYRDELGDWRDERSWQHQLEEEAWQKQWDEDERAYGREQDAKQWAWQEDEREYSRQRDQEQWDYQKEQDALDRAWQEALFAYQQSQDALDQSWREQQFAYQKEQDAYQREWNEDEREYSRRRDEDLFTYQQQQDALDRAWDQDQRDWERSTYTDERDYEREKYEEQWAYQQMQDELDRVFRQQQLALQYANSGGGGGGGYGGYTGTGYGGDTYTVSGGEPVSIAEKFGGKVSGAAGRIGGQSRDPYGGKETLQGAQQPSDVIPEEQYQQMVSQEEYIMELYKSGQISYEEAMRRLGKN